MNKVIEVGRLTKDPDVRYSTGAKATAIARFTIAVDRRFKRDGEPDADFFNCTAFGKSAEFIEKYITKGNKVAIIGTLQNNDYEKDGVKHHSVQILVDEIESCESKKGASDSNSNPNPNPAPNDGFMNIPTGIDDELPFT